MSGKNEFWYIYYMHIPIQVPVSELPYAIYQDQFPSKFSYDKIQAGIIGRTAFLKTPFIQFSQVHFRYPEQIENSTDIIHSVSFSIDPGEYIAIVGSNGSGKTTLVKLIDGLLQPTSGYVEIAGLSPNNVNDIRNIRRKVGMVFQSPEDQIVATTVEEDIAFGLENFGVPTKEMHARVRKVMEGFDLWEIRQRPSYMLSGGQTQRLALASVLAIQPECIIFDEATSMLDPAARKNLLGVMKSFHKEGKTIIHITHSMDEATQADRILVMNKGELVFDGTPTNLFTLEQIDKKWNLEYPEKVGLLNSLRVKGVDTKSIPQSIPELAKYILENFGIKAHTKLDNGKNKIQDPYIEVNDLVFDYLKGTLHEVRALGGVSFNVRQGKGHGLIGKTGSGKSTVLQHLNGIYRPQNGTVRVGEYSVKDETVDMKILVKIVGLVMQNPENQFFEYYTGDEIAFGPKNVGYDGKLSDRVRFAMDLVGLDFQEFKDRPVYNLSGGEKRKVALASILAMKPSVLLLDEPTAGLDPRSRKDILECFLRLKSDGVTIIVSSHNLGDISQITDTLTILENGHSVLNGNTDDVLSNPDIMLNHGIDPPFLTKLTFELTKLSGTDYSSLDTLEQLLSALVVKGNGID